MIRKLLGRIIVGFCASVIVALLVSLQISNPLILALGSGFGGALGIILESILIENKRIDLRIYSFIMCIVALLIASWIGTKNGEWFTYTFFTNNSGKWEISNNLCVTAISASLIYSILLIIWDIISFVNGKSFSMFYIFNWIYSPFGFILSLIIAPFAYFIPLIFGTVIFDLITFKILHVVEYESAYFFLENKTNVVAYILFYGTFLGLSMEYVKLKIEIDEDIQEEIEFDKLYP